MNGNGVEREAVIRHLERVLASTPFRQTERSAGLLRYLVERSLNGNGSDRVKEYTVGVEFLGRGTEFDPRTDPIVRAEASRLRGRLERYYADEGQTDEVVIELPKGSYVPRFQPRAIPTVDEPAQVERQGLRPGILWAAFMTLAVVAAFVAGIWTARSPAPPNETMSRLDVELQSDESIGSDVGTDVVISPDGSRAAFTSIDSLGRSHLRVRAFDGTRPVDLPGTIGARGQFWSPDGRYLGFWAAGQLRKIAVAGGSPTALCDADDLLGASWGDDGTIIAALDVTKRLWRVDGTSGGKRVAIDLTARNVFPRWPQILPGGKRVLYTAFNGVSVDQSSIEVAALAGGEPRVLAKGATFGRYVAPQHLTFVNQGTLFAEQFNPGTLEIRGAKVPILSDVAYSSTFGFAQVSIAETGAMIYRRASSIEQRIVARIDTAGRQTRLLDAPGQWDWPVLSPDGQRLAVNAVESGVARLSVFTNLGEHAHLAGSSVGLDKAAWTPDGRQLVARGDSGIVWLSASGTDPRPLIRSSKILVPWSFGPDGRLAFTTFDQGTGPDLWTAPVEKIGDALRAGSGTPIVRTPSYEFYPAISPDGRWLAYGSGESGWPEIIVRSLADSSIKVVIRPGTGRAPRWSRRGRQLFFTRADGRIMVVTYSVIGGRFVASTPRQWSSIRLANTGVVANYDVGADDGYIVALLPAPSRNAQAENHVTLIRGFPAELQQKTP